MGFASKREDELERLLEGLSSLRLELETISAPSGPELDALGYIRTAEERITEFWQLIELAETVPHLDVASVLKQKDEDRQKAEAAADRLREELGGCKERLSKLESDLNSLKAKLSEVNAENRRLNKRLAKRAEDWFKGPGRRSDDDEE